MTKLKQKRINKKKRQKVKQKKIKERERTPWPSRPRPSKPTGRQTSPLARPDPPTPPYPPETLTPTPTSPPFSPTPPSRPSPIWIGATPRSRRPSAASTSPSSPLAEPAPPVTPPAPRRPSTTTLTRDLARSYLAPPHEDRVAGAPHRLPQIAVASSTSPDLLPTPDLLVLLPESLPAPRCPDLTLRSEQTPSLSPIPRPRPCEPRRGRAPLRLPSAHRACGGPCGLASPPATTAPGLAPASPCRCRATAPVAIAGHGLARAPFGRAPAPARLCPLGPDGPQTCGARPQNIKKREEEKKEIKK